MKKNGWKKLVNCTCGDCDVHFRYDDKDFHGCFYKDFSTDGGYHWHVGWHNAPYVFAQGSCDYILDAKKAVKAAIKAEQDRINNLWK